MYHTNHSVPVFGCVECIKLRDCNIDTRENLLKIIKIKLTHINEHELSDEVILALDEIDFIIDRLDLMEEEDEAQTFCCR